MQKFFNDLKNASDNYTVYSAPTDITNLDEIPQEYDEKATVFYDTDAQGEFDPADVFRFDNYGAQRFGKRGSSRFRKRYDVPTVDFAEQFREALLMGNTGKKDNRIGSRFNISEPHEA